MYYYKLTLRNGNFYYIKDRESNINEFMKTIAKSNNWRDFLLASEKTYMCEFGENKVNTDTVMLLTSEIISVEYQTGYGK